MQSFDVIDLATGRVLRSLIVGQGETIRPVLADNETLHPVAAPTFPVLDPAAALAELAPEGGAELKMGEPPAELAPGAAPDPLFEWVAGLHAGHTETDTTTAG